MEIGPILRAMLRNKPRMSLIMAQMAVTLAIVANCVALIQDARRKMSNPRAFEEDDLIQIQLPCPNLALRDGRERKRWAEENMARVRGILGVQAVTMTRFSPFYYSDRGYVRKANSDGPMNTVSVYPADERFPEVTGVQIDEGTWFSREEVQRVDDREYGSENKPRERNPEGKMLVPVVSDAVISRALGEHLFGTGPLVGKMLERHNGDFLRIVGVIGRYYAPTFTSVDTQHVVFRPGRPHSFEYGLRLLARAVPGQGPVVVQRIEENLSKDFDFADKTIWLVSESKNLTQGTERMTAALMGILIALLVFVAALGIAGLTSFSVTERTRQIGTRRALGATTSDILRYFLTESGVVTSLGLVLGAGLAALLNMALLKIYDSAKLSSIVVAACAVFLWLVALGAALPPALRASRISPAIATKNV